MESLSKNSPLTCQVDIQHDQILLEEEKLLLEERVKELILQLEAAQEKVNTLYNNSVCLWC